MSLFILYHVDLLKQEKITPARFAEAVHFELERPLAATPLNRVMRDVADFMAETLRIMAAQVTEAEQGKARATGEVASYEEDRARILSVVADVKSKILARVVGPMEEQGNGVFVKRWGEEIRRLIGRLPE